MANPQTTHVIEIETGIGEPAFIPLSMGHELQPISVGKKGMWRLESARVLDVHAFVYFDGTSLFLQSADEQNAASVDGYRVGKAWTELHAPCKIEIGNARLRFRSLLADADNQPTMMAPAPVQPGPTGSRPGGAPGASMPVAGAPPPPPAGSSGSAPGMSFPKADRPFKPGEFSGAQDTDESTRIAPLDATGGGRAASGAPRPAAGQPIGDGPATRPEAARAMGQSGAVRALGGPFDGGGMQGGPMMQPDMSQGGPPMQSGAFPQQSFPPPQQGFQNQGYPAGGSGAYGAIPGAPGMPGGMGPSMPPGGYGSMTPQGGMQQPGAPQAPPNDLMSKLKANSIPKIVAGLLFIVGGILYLAEDDEPQPVKKKPIASLDGGSVEGGLAGGSGSGTGADASPGAAPTAPMAGPISPSWPAGVPCPPPNWPPNTPLPCTPNNIPTTPDRPDRNPNEKGGKDAGAKAGEPKDAGTTLPAGVKTLERQAVDYVAAGDTAKAATAYEELVRRDPNNKVYAEAARILRAKLDAGAQ
jgi:hypothetical protein